MGRVRTLTTLANATTILLACSRPQVADAPATVAQVSEPTSAATPAPRTTVSARTSLAPPDAKLREQLRVRLEELGVPAQGELMGQAIVAADALPLFYELQAYTPAWLDQERGGKRAQVAIDFIANLERHGLRADQYHLDALRELTSRPLEPPERIAFELLLTDAVLAGLVHLAHGRVDPVTIHPQWTAPRRDRPVVEALSQAVDKGELATLLDDVVPSDRAYGALVAALETYRAHAASGEWPSIPRGEIGPKSGGKPVQALRRRLIATGDLEAGAADGDRVDATLTQAVVAYQTRHGLARTGVVDAATRKTLNVSGRRRVKQIEANLERWRWLPDSLGKRHVVVNIAGFEVTAVAGSERLGMKAVVGKSYRKTPVFSDRISHIVVNPRWSVPNKLAVRDILPKVQKDPQYLAEKGLRVFSLESGVEKEVDAATIDWSRVSARKFPYKLRQRSGVDNALGRLKFVFPNKYDVYLHDTPKRDLFGWSDRALSSGCIRLERPLDLALLLLRGDPSWPKGSLEKAIASGVEQTIWLAEPVPVHLLYWTTWVDADGRVQFRRDLYGRDDALIRALDELAPRSGAPSKAGRRSNR